jgi:thymidylate synthase
MSKADAVYLKLLKDILDNGIQKSDRTGTGTVSVFGRMIRFNMADGFPLLTTKKMYTKGIITELLWFLNGDTNIKSLVEQGNNIWVGDAYKKYVSSFDDEDGNWCHPECDILSKSEFIEKIKTDTVFADKWGELGPVYGKQWTDWGGHGFKYDKYGDYTKGINQIDNVIDSLKNNPSSRRIMVNAWNVGELDSMTLPPCHYGFQLYTTELTMEEKEEWCKHNSNHMDCPMYKLSLMWNQRSVDTFLGLPFNIASYGFLLHMIAQQVNMIPDELIGSLGDVHIYKNHIDQVKLQLTREPMTLPKLSLNKADSIDSYSLDDFEIVNYKSHPPIKGKLSN